MVTAIGDGWFVLMMGAPFPMARAIRASGSGQQGRSARQTVRVTGIVSARQVGGSSYAAVRTRSMADVTVVDP